ncbi:hypothetical protein GCM10009757_27120 [Streptomyces cheonanensis]|uniref:Putative restriction endonuclease domain-containing protein n=1 Tax=Streptomyces cheonanensis TaxID=312720 RepID=A0ABP5GP31_9ACTN|nr:Uma2 family endonuclease [Streptomyces harbinensis]QKV69929.1 Uma2 family endonuclease [Streptomyces harbinensis]
MSLLHSRPIHTRRHGRVQGGERDRTLERRCYARAGIPLYLLCDRELETVTLHSEPGSNDYRTVLSVTYGKSLLLPEPFGFELETADLI